MRNTKFLIAFLRMREPKQRNGLFSLVGCLRYFSPEWGMMCCWWYKTLAAGLSPRISTPGARPFHVRFVIDVTRRDFVLGTLRSSPVHIPQQIPGTHWFIHHRRSINTAAESVFKQYYPLSCKTSHLFHSTFCVLENRFLLLFLLLWCTISGPGFLYVASAVPKLFFWFRDT